MDAGCVSRVKSRGISFSKTLLPFEKKFLEEEELESKQGFQKSTESLSFPLINLPLFPRNLR